MVGNVQPVAPVESTTVTPVSGWPPLLPTVTLYWIDTPDSNVAEMVSAGSAVVVSWHGLR